MFFYGKMHENGIGIPVNKSEAKRYYKMAAENGNSSAMKKYTILTS